MDKRKTPGKTIPGKTILGKTTPGRTAPGRAANADATPVSPKPAQPQAVESKAAPHKAAPSQPIAAKAETTADVKGAPAKSPEPPATQTPTEAKTEAKVSAPHIEKPAPAAGKAPEAPKSSTATAAPPKALSEKGPVAAPKPATPELAAPKPATPAEPPRAAHAAIAAQAEATLRQTEALSKLAEEAVAATRKTAQAAAARQTPAAKNAPGHEGASPLATIASSGLEQARQVYVTAQEQRDTWNRNVLANANVASKAANEINGKILDLVRSQTDATLGLWRSLIGVTSVAEAVELQTRELRRQYEDATVRVRDIAETATRYAHDVVTTAKGDSRHR